ncbi:hypothetical protein SAMN06295888_11953 [Desulfonatronum zhilinae]|nr:hypothetical protein SAMN06295888_11953 [Desulfonatronum zhilinae]
MFGNVDIKVRPVKLAYLVDPNNATQVRAAIQLSSSLWGGAFFPIIPLYRRIPATWRNNSLKAPSARSTILGFIDAFDPDILVQFSKSVPSYISLTGLQIIKPQEIWERFSEYYRPMPVYGIGIFELLGDIYREYFKYKAKYPVKVVLPKIPRQLALFWTSIVGEIPEKLLPALESEYFEPLEIERIQLEPSKLSELLERDVLFPRRISAYGISVQSRRSFGRGAAAFFMDASKLEDVVDYWNLRATGRDILPLPKQFKDVSTFWDTATRFFKAHRVHWRHQPQHCDTASIIQSRNSTMEEMQEFVKGLKIERPPNDPSNDGFFVLQHWYPRIWDKWARDHDGAIADIYGKDEESLDIMDQKKGGFRFRSLLPEFSNKHACTGEVRCMNEISFRFYGTEEHLAEVFPKASGERFQRAILNMGSITEWRIGQHGLVKFVQYEFSETRDLPTSEPIFFAWLVDQGWSAELSAPGILAKQILQKLGGRVGVLRDEKLLGLIEYMNGGSVNADGTPVVSNKIGQDRDMPVSEVKSRLEGTGRRDLHDYLVSKGIFKLGLRTQCPICQRRSWFPLAALTDNLNCPKCLNSFPATGNIDRGVWCYKTAGPFSVPRYAEGAYTTLLALDFFSNRRLTTMRTTPVLSFTAKNRSKGDLEADFGLFWSESIYGGHQDGLVFGECKTYGPFTKKDFGRMQHLAKNFPGAVLVFCTLRKSLTKEEIAGITRIARTGRKYWKAERPINPVLVLTGTELLTHERPPYCWREKDQERPEWISGFLSVCDATQQRYLNLPSWHTEWHDKWKMRRKRYMARQEAATQHAKAEARPGEAKG